MQEALTIVQNLSFANLDLLSVGFTIAAIALLGFVAYINNPKSATNIAFVLFCLITVLWSFANYISYQVHDPTAILWFTRIVVFLGLWHSFTFFNFFYVFPLEIVTFPRWYKYALFPYVISVSILTLSPFVFSGLESVASNGGVSKAVVENGIIIFIVTVIILLLESIVMFVRKIRKAPKSEKRPYVIILFGTIVTFALLFTFNLILPTVFSNVRFIPLGALCIFPFAAATAYSIHKHKTFRIRNIASSMFAFLLCMATFVEIIFATSPTVLFLRGAIFLFALLISIQFIRNIFKLEAASDQKSEFISFASHEIRTPITVMKGYADLMVGESDTEISEKNRELAKKIMIAGNDVISLISQYLNKSKMELGQLQYSFSVINIAELVKETVPNFKINAEQRKLTLTYHDSGEKLYVNGDAGKLKEVVGNLIDNSLKYTPSGTVDVAIEKKDTNVLISIKDTGVGISKEMISGLFQEFGRADTKKVNILGTGLGLYLAKNFVEAHKGSVWAESDGEGKGSQFYIELPAVENNI
jgi:signal transduction histidine kinase